MTFPVNCKKFCPDTEFFFKSGCYAKVTDLWMPYYLLITRGGEKTDGLMPFLVKYEESYPDTELAHQVHSLWQ